RIGPAIELAAAFSALLYSVLPSADVTMAPARSQINTTMSLVADPKLSTVNVETVHIPATVDIIDVTTQASIPTTDSKDVPNSLASGTVVFTNQTGSPVFIPAGTVVTSIGRDPARFRTTADATVDGGVGQ